jgi:hypothetical protein
MYTGPAYDVLITQRVSIVFDYRLDDLGLFPSEARIFFPACVQTSSKTYPDTAVSENVLNQTGWRSELTNQVRFISLRLKSL